MEVQDLIKKVRQIEIKTKKLSSELLPKCVPIPTEMMYEI
jgi:hypothetical protein